MALPALPEGFEEVRGAAAWQKEIDEAASEHGVDPELVTAVLDHESRGNHRAVSPKGAKGLLQLMDPTAKALGVKDSFDPVQNIRGGTKLLRQLLDKYDGDVSLALAAYNAGEGAVAKYGGIPPYKETRNYVKSILPTYQAMKGMPAGFQADHNAPLTPEGFVEEGQVAPPLPPGFVEVGEDGKLPELKEPTVVKPGPYFGVEPFPEADMVNQGAEPGEQFLKDVSALPESGNGPAAQAATGVASVVGQSMGYPSGTPVPQGQTETTGPIFKPADVKYDLDMKPRPAYDINNEFDLSKEPDRLPVGMKQAGVDTSLASKWQIAQAQLQNTGKAGTVPAKEEQDGTVRFAVPNKEDQYTPEELFAIKERFFQAALSKSEQWRLLPPEKQKELHDAFMASGQKVGGKFDKELAELDALVPPDIDPVDLAVFAATGGAGAVGQGGKEIARHAALAITGMLGIEAGGEAGADIEKAIAGTDYGVGRGIGMGLAGAGMPLLAQGVAETIEAYWMKLSPDARLKFGKDMEFDIQTMRNRGESEGRILRYIKRKYGADSEYFQRANEIRATGEKPTEGPRRFIEGPEAEADVPIPTEPRPPKGGPPVEAKPPTEPKPTVPEATAEKPVVPVEAPVAVEPTPTPAPEVVSEDYGFKEAFGTAKNAVSDSFIRDAWTRLESGKKLLNRTPGTVEIEIQRAFDSGSVKSQDDVRSIVERFYGPKEPEVTPEVKAEAPKAEPLPDLNPQIRDYVDTKIRELGSIQAVDEFYGDDAVGKYARGAAPGILGEKVPAVPEMPSEIVEESGAEEPVVQPTETIYFPEDSREYDEDAFYAFKDAVGELSSAEGPSIRRVENATGKAEFSKLASGNPKWFVNKGWKKEQILRIEKALDAGKKLTPVQKKIADEIILAKLNEYRERNGIPKTNGEPKVATGEAPFSPEAPYTVEPVKKPTKDMASSQLTDNVLLNDETSGEVVNRILNGNVGIRAELKAILEARIRDFGPKDGENQFIDFMAPSNTWARVVGKMERSGIPVKEARNRAAELMRGNPKEGIPSYQEKYDEVLRKHRESKGIPQGKGEATTVEDKSAPYGAERINTETPEFKKWSGNAPIADDGFEFETGKPVIAKGFHGTTAYQDFESFAPHKRGSQTGAPSASNAFFFAADSETAASEDYIGTPSDMRQLQVRQDWGTMHERLPDALVRAKKLAARLEAEFESVKSKEPEGLTLKQRLDFWRSEGNKDKDLRSVNLLIDELQGAIKRGGGKWMPGNPVSAENRFLIERIFRLARKFPESGLRELIPSTYKRARIIPAYLSFKNPLVHDFEGLGYRDESYDGLIKQAIRDGNDGVIFTNTTDGGPQTTIFGVFDPTQIKSIFNKGTFDPSNPDILAQKGKPYASKENHARITAEATNPPSGLSTSGGEFRRGGTRVLGIGIRKELAATGRLDLKGKKANTAEEVAMLMQIARHPDVEHFYRLYMDEDGKVLAYEQFTARMPGAAVAYEGDAVKDTAKIVQRAKRLGASRITIVHNHPTGDPTPSDADVKLTRDMAWRIHQAANRLGVDVSLDGHVVINSGKYAEITMTTKDVFDLDMPKDWKDKLLEPSVEHPVIGQKVMGNNDVARLSKMVDSVDGNVPILYRAADGSVRAVETIPFGQLMAPGSHAGDYLRGRMREYGSTGVVAYLDKAYFPDGLDDTYARNIVRALDELVREGSLLDTVYGEGLSVSRGRGVTPMTGLWGGKSMASGGVRVTEPEEKYGLDLPELVSLAKELLSGKYPQVAQALRKKGALGTFSPRGEGEIKLKASNYTDEELAKKVLAHEIGHLVDYLPDRLLQRGNILGRIATLKRYLSTTIDELPTDPSRYLSKADRAALRRKAIAEAKRQGSDSKEEHAAMVQEIYRDLVDEEIASRGLITRDEIIEELRGLTQTWNPFDVDADPKYTQYRHSSKELYADALSAILVDPQLVRTEAPKFWDAFFGYMVRKPEVQRIYDAFQDSINSGEIYKQRVENLYGGFRRGEDAYAKSVERDTRFSERARIELIDLHHGVLGRLRPMEKAIPPSKNPRYAIEAMTYSGAEAEHHITQVYHDVMKPLRKAGLSWEQFGEYLFHLRVSTERAKLANPMGWTKGASERRIEEIRENLGPDKMKSLEDAKDAFRKWHLEDVVERAKQAGMYSEDLIKAMEDYDNYATFNVIKYMENKYGGGATAAIHRQHGTHQEITNPATATIMKDLAIIRAVNRNIAAKTTTDFMREHYPDEITPAEKKWNGKHMAAQETHDPAKGTIFLLNEGKLEGWDVPKSVAQSFEQNPVEGMLIAQVLKAIANPFRSIFTELNYGFWMFNIVRDYKRAARNLPGATMLNFSRHWFKGLRPAFRSVVGIPGSVVQEMQKGKMLISVADNRGLRSEEKQEERLLVMHGLQPRKAGNPIFRAASKTWSAMGLVGRGLERTTKVAGYNFLKERQPGMSEEEMRHIVLGQVGSPDFLRRGGAAPIYNNLLLFSNAAKEGWRGDIDAMRRSPLEWWWKTTKYSILPKVLMMAAALGLFGEGIKRILKGASEYDKTNYTVIPLGETETGKSVYIRIPDDENGRLLAGTLWKAFMHQRHNWYVGLADYMAGQAPTLNPAIQMMIAVGQYAAGQNPYDWFRGREAIPDLTHKAGGWRSHKEMLKWTANQMGSGIVYRFQSDDIERSKTELEKILALPFVSNSLGRFLKVSDAGLRDEIRNEKEIIQERKADEILSAREGLAKMVDGQMPSDKEKISILAHPDVVQNWQMKMISKKSGSVYFEEWTSSKSTEEKIKVLQLYFKNNPTKKTDTKQGAAK